VREGEWITAYSIAWVSVEEPLARFREALRARNFDEMRKAVWELYEARFNRTLWQIVYEFDRERAAAALEYLRGKYGVSEGRLWERFDELFVVWLMFRVADEFEAYLRSGAGRRLEKEAFGELLGTGRWLPVEAAPLFWLRLVGDPEGGAEFRNAWVTAVNMWFERMAEPYQPKKPAVARKAVELFNAFVGAKFTYEELFPPPPKPEAAKLAQRPEVVKPETAAKPEAVKPAEAKPAGRPAVEVVEERGLRREAAKPEAVRPEAPRSAAEAVEVRGLRREERPRAPVADVIPERVLEAVDYLLERFGVVLDVEAAFKAKSLVTAKVKARLEKVAVKEPEFAHILAEVAERVLSSFGRLMASPDAARHVHEALFYYFEGYQTRDGELLFARIERTVREAVRKAEEAGIPDAEYRIKQFILEIIDILARAGERYRRDALKAVSTVEKTLRATAFAGLSAAALYSVYHGLYSEAVLSSVATAAAFAEVGRFKEAVEYVQKAAKALYEAAKDVFERVKVTVQRLIELFIEAVTRALAWIDEHKAYLFLNAAVMAGVVTLSTALNIWGLIELDKLAYAASAAPFVAGLAETGGKAAERFRRVADRWRMDENEKQKIEKIVNEVINAPQKGERPFSKLASLEKLLPPPLAEMLMKLKRIEDKVVQDAAAVAALVLYKTLVKNAEVYGEWAKWYKWARSLVEKQELAVSADDIKRLRETHNGLEEAAEDVRRELDAVLTLYSLSGFYKERPDLFNKLKQLLEVDLGKAEELAETRVHELSEFRDVNMGTKAYAALLSIARGGIYGHAAMLLMEEGALADIVLIAPTTMHLKARNIAKMRGETVHPSYSRRGAVDLEDRATSVLLRFLIGYGEIDPQLSSGAGEVSLKFRLVKKDGKENNEKKLVEGNIEKIFKVFKAYGGVEAFVGELWIGVISSVAFFNVNEEELKRLVEEVKRTAPDLSGLDKSRQYVEWLATDATIDGRQIVAGTVHSWQLRWYFSLFGEEETFYGKANITKEGINLYVYVYRPRERGDQILAESRWLESLLNQQVKSWRELVDAINWSWVLERVEELADKLKPWIGSEKMDDVEREGLARRMLGELALFVHFAEARRGKSDEEWREERVKRLARAVEALISGRITGDDTERRIVSEYAERLARAIIRYAEGQKKGAEEKINRLAEELAKILREDAKKVKGEVWSIVEFVLSDMYCPVRDCARDEVARKFVAPALELIMLDKALRGEFDREEVLLWFGEMYATALAGDGHAGRRSVGLTVGGELGGGAALLRLATLHLLNQLLPEDLKFYARIYMIETYDKIYNKIEAYGENAARFMRLLAVSAPSAGGEYLSPKFDQFVEEAKVEVQVGNIRETEGGAAAELTISVASVAVKYNVYLRDQHSITLEFLSTDRSRVELAALLLRHVGVAAEVRKEGDRDIWRIDVTTNKLATAREDLRKALAEIVREAEKKGWVSADTAERWLEKLEKGRVLKEGWPQFYVGLSSSGALEVRYQSTSLNSIEQVAQRLEEMGLKRGVHFSMRMPDNGKIGYVSILREGLAYAAYLSERGKDKDQRELAVDFVEYILKRAEKEGKDVLEKAKRDHR